VAQDGETLEGKAQRPPLSAHPAFPLIVGLWFAALLGLGTIVLPAVVLEKVAGLTGLVEPPLTAAARAVMALLATVAGLAGGLVLARRVAQAQQAGQPPRRRRPVAAGRQVRPLSVHDDLGEEAIAPANEEKKAFPGRRRALAVIEDERPSDFLMAAPLPGGEHAETPELPTDEDAMSERPSDFEAPMPAEPASEELDLSNLVAESPIYDPPAEEAPVEQPSAEAQVFEPEPYVPALDTRKPRDLAAPPVSEPSHHADELVVEPIDAPLEDLGIVQLAERLGRSMQKRLSVPQPQAEPAQALEADPLEFSAPSLEQPEPEEPALAVPPPVVPDALRAFMGDTPEEVAPQPAAEQEAIAVPPPVVPAALQPFTLDSFEADDDELDPGPFTLPLDTMRPRPFDSPAAPAAADDPVDAELSDEEEDADEALADESYSSLLSMKNPFRGEEEFVRVEEPEAADDTIEPAVVFPGQEAAAAEPAPPAEAEAQTEAEEPPRAVRRFDAPHQPAPSTAPVHSRKAPDPVETERALRSALANLQRMSGAA
jgi:hypothetical protein